MYKICNKVMKLITEAMKNWKEELTTGGESVAEEKIRSGILQGGALLPLLFVIAMIPLKAI